MSQLSLNNNSQHDNAKESSSKVSDKILKKTNPKKRTEIQNPFELVPEQTYHRGEFLMVKFPEENKMDQLNKVAKILQIPLTNNLIHHQVYRSNSWIIISFQN